MFKPVRVFRDHRASRSTQALSTTKKDSHERAILQDTMAPPTPTDRTLYEQWVAAENARKAKEELAAKRDANVIAKDARSAVQMAWEDKAPPYYQKVLAAKRRYPPLTPEQERAASRREFSLEARRIFRLMDIDQSKALDNAELRHMTQSPEMADFLIHVWDMDGDGKVQMHEWIDFIMSVWATNEEGAGLILEEVERTLARRAFEACAEQLFDRADRDKSGTLDFFEVRALCEDEVGRLQRNSFEMFYEGMDKDGDFNIDKGEWMGFNSQVYEHSPYMARLLLNHYEHSLTLRSKERAWQALCKELFEGFDVNGSGSLEAKEILAFTNPEAHDDERWQTARNFLSEADWDESGTLELDEFCDFMMSFYHRNRYMAHRFAGTLLRDLNKRRAKEAHLAEASKLFEEYDLDGNGSLSLTELIEMIGATSVLAVLNFMAAFDSDMSGSIELSEWRDFADRSWEANRIVSERFIKTLRYQLKRKRAKEREEAALQTAKRYF